MYDRVGSPPVSADGRLAELKRIVLVRGVVNAAEDFVPESATRSMHPGDSGCRNVPGKGGQAKLSSSPGSGFGTGTAGGERVRTGGLSE
jgi:hypothetical protein